jgi:serine/threonine protein kinase
MSANSIVLRFSLSQFLLPLPLIRVASRNLFSGALLSPTMNITQLPLGQSRQPPFNFSLILNGTFAGITHVHSLGLAPSDITLSNIMLDGNGCAVIINFNNSGTLGVPCRSVPLESEWTNFFQGVRGGERPLWVRVRTPGESGCSASPDRSGCERKCEL